MNLSDAMQFGTVVRVADDGNFTTRHQLYPSAPEVEDPDPETQEPTVSHGWGLLGGFTGQHGYNGVCMHSSEFIGGGLERHILETPGYYVSIALGDSWVVAYTDIAVMDTVIFAADGDAYEAGVSEVQKWQVSAITDDGIELIGYADVHNYAEDADELILIAKG